jgi:fluoroquinolone resistance protein
METDFFEDLIFEKQDYSNKRLTRGEYDHCRFIKCDFSNADVANIQFVDCTFEECNLTMVKLEQTACKTISFLHCKLLGLHFHECNDFLFAVKFDNCTIKLTSFYGLKMKKTMFRNSAVNDVDFTDADISQCVFDNCDLLGSIFKNTNLEKADLTTASNYSIDPELNRLKKAKFSIPAVVGLLDKYDILIK